MVTVRDPAADRFGPYGRFVERDLAGSLRRRGRCSGPPAGVRGGTMKAEALTPAEIFGYHVRYVVPLFQRPYVWNRRDQWEPLWDDVRAVAEKLLDSRGAVAPHFLGAIVVEQAPTLVGSVAVYHVI